MWAPGTLYPHSRTEDCHCLLALGSRWHQSPQHHHQGCGGQTAAFLGPWRRSTVPRGPEEPAAWDRSFRGQQEGQDRWLGSLERNKAGWGSASAPPRPLLIRYTLPSPGASSRQDPRIWEVWPQSWQVWNLVWGVPSTCEQAPGRRQLALLPSPLGGCPAPLSFSLTLKSPHSPAAPLTPLEPLVLIQRLIWLPI